MEQSENIQYFEDEVFGERLLISSKADQSEVADNIRAARAILCSFPETKIVVTEHRMIIGEKNPEYIIDGLVGDRKGVHSEKGIRSSFEKGKKQNCQVIVIDLDKNMTGYPLRTIKLAKELYFRNKDFSEGFIVRCYVVYHGRAVLLTPAHFTKGKEEGVSGFSRLARASIKNKVWLAYT